MSFPNPIEGVQSLPPALPWRDEASAQASPSPIIRGIPPGEMELRSGSKGPVTASRHMRNALVYAGLCVLGVLPMLGGMSPGWQAFGLGLFMPGAGFLAAGGLAILVLPLPLPGVLLSVVA